jgi:hypothetical protein
LDDAHFKPPPEIILATDRRFFLYVRPVSLGQHMAFARQRLDICTRDLMPSGYQTGEEPMWWAP